MKFKKGKYNIIFLLMFVLIMGVFGFEMFSITPSQNIPVLPGTEGEVSGEKNDEGGSDDKTNVDQEVEISNEIDKNMPSPKFPLKVLNYVLNKLYEGDGYKSTYKKTMTNTANVMGGITVTQEINGTIDKSGNKSYEQLEFKATGSMSDMAVNLIRAFYFDGDNVTRYQTEPKNYDFSTAAKTEMTKAEYYTNFALNLADAPIFAFTQSNFSFTLNTQKNKAGVEYYVINATLTNPSILNSSGYSRYYETSGDLKDVKAVSATFTYSCYAKSGNIFSISAEEKYVGTNPAFGVPVDVNVNYTQTFTATNTAFVIEKP